jgi:hypothetical protein
MGQTLTLTRGGEQNVTQTKVAAIAAAAVV